ncbi:MAG: molybdopterin dinucleotide binding domain-containing protein [Candidatus Bathyarchaeia archaeon]
MYHSELRQIRPAKGKVSGPIVSINAETARRLGIFNGDWVWIETRFGRIKQRARLTNEVHPNMLHVQHGWWHPEMSGEDPVLLGCLYQVLTSYAQTTQNTAVKRLEDDRS